jgi:thioredoxin reductase
MHRDAIIIGGSFAGLAAATYIGRARRSVAVIDAGLPRNRFAAHSHGFLSQDGSTPGDILTAARAQVAAYPSVTMIAGEATAARTDGSGFAVTLGSGETLTADRLVLAFGLSDELPGLPGISERWGNSVIICPYCHGFEFSGRRLGVLAMSPMSSHQAMLVSEWGPVTYFANGFEPDEATLAEFAHRGIAVERTPVVGLEGSAPALSAARLADGRNVPIEALFIGPQSRLNSDIADQLGCAFDEAPFGRIIRVDAMKETTMPGVFAVGDISRGMHSVTFAAADGVLAGTALHRSLVFPVAA